MQNKDAVALAKKVLRKEVLKTAASYVAPFFWDNNDEDGSGVLHNGSIFFLDCGEEVFAVTANHVYQGYRTRKEKHPSTTCQIMNLPYDPENRLIDYYSEYDIATFRISEEEVENIGKAILTGSQSTWPPEPPVAGKGVFFAGYPGKARLYSHPNKVDFGLYMASTIAQTVNNRHISCQFDRDNMEDTMGNGLPPQGYDLGGLSGAPLITVVETNNLWTWRLGGVIYEASPRLEIIFASRADFILSDGRLRK